MNHNWFSLCCVILFLCFLPVSVAQTSTVPDQPSKEEIEKQQKELERKGYQLLVETAGEIPAMRSARNRARYLATTADLLWKYDEPRARALFNQARENLQRLTGSESVNTAAYGSRYNSLKQLRSEIVQMIAGHDVELALNFIHSTRIPLPPNMIFSSHEDPEAELEMQLAGRIAQTNPQRALELGETALAKGVTSQTLDILNQLQNKDPALMSTFATDVVKALQSENLLTDNLAFNVTLNLLRTSLQGKDYLQRANSEQTPANLSYRPMVLDDQSLRKLVSLLSSMVDSLTTNGNLTGAGNTPWLLSSIRFLSPQLEKYGLMTDSIRSLSSGGSSLPDPSQAWNDYNAQVAKNPTAEAWLQAATTAPAQVRNNYYQQAAQQALNAGDVARARQIITANVPEGYQRSDMLNSLENQVIMKKASTGKIEEARQMAAAMSNTEERVRALQQLSAMALQKGDKKLASDILDDARRLMTFPPENQSQLNAIISLVQSYIPVAPARALELLNLLPAQLDLLLDAAQVLDPFEHTYDPMFKEGEISVVEANFLAQPLQQISQCFALISLENFEGAKSGVDSFQHMEVRVDVHLAMARQLLSGRQSQKYQGPLPKL
jgi:hypothetical protein